jgi:hypothetical protein
MFVSLFVTFVANADLAYDSSHYPVSIDAAHFPNKNFRNFVKHWWSPNDSILTYSEATSASHKSVILVSSWNITSVTGIEYLPKITHIEFRGIQANYIDLSHNPELKGVYITDCTALTTFNAGSFVRGYGVNKDKLDTLDVSGCSALKELYVDDVPNLRCINLNNCTSLGILSCSSDPKLTQIDVSTNTALTSLNCQSDALTSLDVTHNRNLQKLYCLLNYNISSLNLANNPQLKILDCSDDNLSRLDLTNNSNLTTVCFANNHINSLDLSKSSITTIPYTNYVNNGRTIPIYSYKRSQKNGGQTGYYVPLGQLETYIGDGFLLSHVNSDSWSGITEKKFSPYINDDVLILPSKNAKYTYDYYTKYPNKSYTVNFYLQGSASDVVTGTDEIFKDGFEVTPSKGCIDVSGDVKGNIEVYDMNGRSMYMGSDTHIEVPAGIYVVILNGHSVKVLVN